MVRKAAELSGRAVISGLALGCDTAAHRAALDAGVPTIAVLPCAIDKVCPASNRQLAEEILQRDGLVLSEYPPGTPTAKWMFVKRDALIADLSDAVIVIEKGAGNGTMHTVREALKREKPVGYYQQGDGLTDALAEMNITGIPDTPELKEFLEHI
jgi:DNA processing protein